MRSDSRVALRNSVRREVPERPGVYTWLSASGERLYVGKSVNLRQRMLSYLVPGQLDLDSRHRHLASSVAGFEWRDTPGELLALLLEDALIKRLNPRHNERQRDWRERRYVLLTDDPFPTCLVVEDPRRPGTLFGPFKDEYFARALVELIDDAFGLRACTNAEPYLRSPRFDLGACPGPCRGAISVADYAAVGERVRAFLEGDESWISARLRDAMERAGESLRFEDAAMLRDRLDFCRRFCARQRFFRQFEHGTMVVEEPRFGLHYRFEAGVLLEVHNGGISVPVPPELREDAGDRRFFLDRANLLYTWRGRHGEDAPG